MKKKSHKSIIKVINANGATWIDIQNPQEKDLEELKEKFHLHPFICQQFLPPLHRQKIEEYNDQLFIALHCPVHDKENRETIPTELDFILTHNILITSHKGDIPPLEIFFNDCKVQDYHQKQYFRNSGFLLFGLLDFLIDSCLPMLDHVFENIINVEKEVFKGQERKMLNEIAIIKRDLINFRRAIKPQHSVLEVLVKKTRRIFGTELRPLAQEVLGSNIRVWNVLENHQEMINSLEQTNNSLLSYKLSDIMKILTVVSFITFPLSVIVGFFGMNIFGQLPIVNNPFTWLVILIFMIISTLIMVVYFKFKKWL